MIHKTQITRSKAMPTATNAVSGNILLLLCKIGPIMGMLLASAICWNRPPFASRALPRGSPLPRLVLGGYCFARQECDTQGP